MPGPVAAATAVKSTPETAGAPRTVIARALEDGSPDLPVLPKVAHDVMLAAQDPNRGAADVARHIERDPALCATVLRSANSAIYGGAVEIGSARQAVARLGMVEVASLAMTAAVRAAVTSVGPYHPQLNLWWRESLTTGLFAKEIARVRRSAVDSAFMCGLLRRVGVPVVLRMLGRGAAELEGMHVADLLAEFAVPAGLLLCDGWRLSAPVRASIAQGTSDDRPTAFGDHVCTAQLAAAFASALANGALDGPPSPTPQTEALNLYPEDLQRIVAASASIASSVENMA
jgi:HD-like signal output (HDOD) protein